MNLIIIPSGVVELAEWCNSFAIVPKPIRKVQLYLDPARLNNTLIRPPNRESTVNDILPKLPN